MAILLGIAQYASDWDDWAIESVLELIEGMCKRKIIAKPIKIEGVYWNSFEDKDRGEEGIKTEDIGHEFDNGLVICPRADTFNKFFSERAEIELPGISEVEEVSHSLTSVEYTVEELVAAIAIFERSSGETGAGDLAKELLRDCLRGGV